MEYICENKETIDINYPNVRKTPSLQGGDISTNLLIFDVFFDNIEGCSAT